MKRMCKKLIACLLSITISFGIIGINSVYVEAADYGTWHWPVPRYTTLSQGFSSSHLAVDIPAPLGTAVCAAKAGTIRLVINNCDHIEVGEGECVHYVNGYAYSNGGNQVYITHDDGTFSIYAHMIKGSITVLFHTSYNKNPVSLISVFVCILCSDINLM